MTETPPPFTDPDFAPPPPAGPGRALPITSLVLGIVSVIPVVGLLMGLAGLVTGIIALAVKARGKGMAVAGIVLSALAPIVMLVAILLPSLSRAKMLVQRTSCRTNLHAIARGIHLYLYDNNQAMPSDLSVLVDQGLLGGELPTCPSPGAKGSQGYVYVARGKATRFQDPSSVILACCRAGNHKEQRPVVYLDGHAESLSEAVFAKQLARPGNAEFAKALREAEGP